MTSRRQFIGHTLTALTLPLGAQALGRSAPRLAGAVRRDETIARLGGMGDGNQMTLRPDGTQLIVVNDGPGWAPPPAPFYNVRIWTLDGQPDAARFGAMPGYPDIDRAARPEDASRWYGHGVIQLGPRIYQFVSTHDNAPDRPQRWTGAKLIWSADGGTTWRNQDGSTPVVWEDRPQQSHNSLAFFDEPDGAFSLLSFLQPMRGQPAARDGWLYVYGLNGNVDGLMNQLVLFRARPETMTERATWQFFAGFGTHGQPRWSARIADRQPIHTYPRGWVNYTNLFPGDLVVESWLPSVVYNAPLGVYLMAAAGIGVGRDGTEFAKPSHLGLWTARNPWGPWRRIHQEDAWCPAGDAQARAYGPQIAPGWIAPDGRSFWLVWSDLKGIAAFGRDEALLESALAKAQTDAERSAINVDFVRRYMPGFSFNAQRIDLTFA